MIVEFKDKYAKFDIFFPGTVHFGGVEFPSVGHAFESARSLDVNWIKTCMNENATEEILFRRHETLEMVPNFDRIKLKVMYALLLQRFSEDPFKELLLSTGGQNITFGGPENDLFWGINWALIPNEGENWLGRMLMEIRSSLRNQT